MFLRSCRFDTLVLQAYGEENKTMPRGHPLNEEKGPWDEVTLFSDVIKIH